MRGEGLGLDKDFFIESSAANRSGAHSTSPQPSPPHWGGEEGTRASGRVRWGTASSAVADVGDGAEGEGRVVLQHLVGIDAVFVAPRPQRPFDLVVVAPRADLHR